MTNHGFIIRGAVAAAASAGTVIVTGLGRSGTTMLADILLRAGLFLGDVLHRTTNEDAAFLEAFRVGDRDLIRSVIAERNRAHRRWGFKLPNLPSMMRPDEVAMFRNPRLLIVMRDPVAIAVRQSIAEYEVEGEALANAVTGTASLLAFTQAVRCPVMLVSYEKAITMPAAAVEGVLGFCGLAASDQSRRELVDAIAPNQAGYGALARRHYEGCIDGVLDGRLVGWIAERDYPDPLPAELVVDGRAAARASADQYRSDLRDAGINDGRHGFAFDLAATGAARSSIIAVRLAGRTFEVGGSGRPLATLPVLAAV